MCKGTDDNGAYNRMTRTLPVQPSRCTGIMTLCEQPTYALFLKSVKTWIRTCVEEGRENELLDNNNSLIAVWNELQNLPTSMNLVKGRKIEVTPHYEWERTSGPPFWRATQITFTVRRQDFAPPYPQFKDSTLPQPTPDPTPIQRATGYTKHFYCSETGVKYVLAKNGEKPQPQADAKSPFFTDEALAQKACRKKPDVPDMPVPNAPTIAPPKPGNRTISKDEDSLDFLRSLTLGIFTLFGIVIFNGKLKLLIRGLFELYGLEKALRDLTHKDVSFHLDKTKTNKQLNINVRIGGKVYDLGLYIEQLLNNGTADLKRYDRLKHLYDESMLQLQELEIERLKDSHRGKKFFNRKWLRDPVRGYFIEDHYIDERLWKSGYVGLPDYFKGFDAYQQGTDFNISISKGRYIATFDNPGLISIKSYEPPDLRKIDVDYLKRGLKEWIKKMDYQEFEKSSIRIVNPKQREIHLILVGNADKREFIDKLEQIRELAKVNNIVIELVQYRTDTGRFISL